MNGFGRGRGRDTTSGTWRTPSELSRVGSSGTSRHGAGSRLVLTDAVQSRGLQISNSRAVANEASNPGHRLQDEGEANHVRRQARLFSSFTAPQGAAQPQLSMDPTQPPFHLPTEQQTDRSDSGQQVPRDITDLQAVYSRFPRRPGWGRFGSPITLRANHFPITWRNNALHDYTIFIEPKPSVRRIRHRILRLLEGTPEFASFKNHVVHDNGARLISTLLLPIPHDGILTVIQYYDEDEEGPGPKSPFFTITISYVAPLDLKSFEKHLSGDPHYEAFNVMPVVSALDIIIAQHPARTGITVGRNRYFFPNESSAMPLGSGLEALKGFYSSVRPTFRQLMVNINTCASAFYREGNLATAMEDYRKDGGSHFAGFVKGLRVETSHLGFKRKQTIKHVSNLSARHQNFICKEYGNSEITVEQYFLIKHGIRLARATDLPVVGIGSSEVKPIWLPAELCFILPHQPFQGKLPDNATSRMIKYACNAPRKNVNDIVQHGLHRLGFQKTTAPPALREFGLTVGNEMTNVPARILPPPSILYAHGRATVDQRASWNFKDKQFKDPKTLNNWAVLIIKDGLGSDFVGPYDKGLIRILEAFALFCNNSGMSVVADPAVTTATLPPKVSTDPFRKQGINAIRDALLRLPNKPSIVLVMLSNSDRPIYAGLKALCDGKLDVHTVCCLSQKIQSVAGQLQYLANVALKVNMKLGGVNHTLDHHGLGWLLNESTIIFGSDVTHPGPGSLKGTPSIAAVVASVDDQFIHYPASLSLQEANKEMITDLATLVQERLEAYREASRELPKRIVFFRDGVSEGQFVTVVSDELPKIREGCSRMTSRTPYRPKITICIAGKRHHTRFYHIDSPRAEKNGNPRPGTVVDRDVTAIYDFDFFLQAHGSLQGTARPTHYYVVHDENNFNADGLQRLVNNTSYMFGRATKAVSVIPPAYYADLACERGRCYIHELLTSGNVGSEDRPSMTAQEVFEYAQEIWGVGVGPTLKKTMFYL